MPLPLASPLWPAPLALLSAARRARDQLALLSPLQPVARRSVALAPVLDWGWLFYLAYHSVSFHGGSIGRMKGGRKE